MYIQIKANKTILINKLKAMYDYIILLEVNNKGLITLSDRHGSEIFNNSIINSNINKIIHRIDRRELINKLKSINDLYLFITFDNSEHKIIITNKNNTETSIYLCSLDTASNIQQTM